MEPVLKLKNVNSRASIFCSIHGDNNTIYGLPIKASNIRQLIDQSFKCSSSKTAGKLAKKVSKISVRSIILY